MKEQRVMASNGSGKKDKIVSKDYILVMLTSSGQAFMNYFLLTALPLYVAKLGGTMLQAGLLLTVYAMVAIIARPISGILTDRFGRVKLMILGALICCTTCMLLGVAGIIPLLMLLRLVNGAGYGLLSTCCGAAVADILPRSRLAEGMGIYGTASTLGQAIAPGIALLVIAGDTISDYRKLFALTAGLCLMSAVASSCITYERKRKQQRVTTVPVPAESAEKPPEGAGSEPLPKTFLGFEYVVLKTAAVLMVMHFSIAGVMTYITPFARWKGFGDPGLYFTVCAIGIIFSRLVFGKVADKRGADVTIIPGMIIMVIGLMLIPFVKSLTALIAIALPLGLAQGAVMPSFSSLIFRRCSPKRRGTASGAYSAAIDSGFAIGAPLLGALADVTDYSYIFPAAAGFVILSLILYVFFVSERRFKKKQL